MNATDVIAYTYDADYHCITCTTARFGQGDHGWVPDDAEDSEGNPVGVVFGDTEWWQTDYECQTLTCADCGAELDIVHADPHSEDCEDYQFRPIKDAYVGFVRGMNEWRFPQATVRMDTDTTPVEYSLQDPDGAFIFTGTDFRVGGGWSGDVHAACASLLAFLTLRPGDVEADFFADYSPAQIAWRDEYAEDLAIITYECDF